MSEVAWPLTLLSLATPDGGVMDVGLSRSDASSADVALIHIHGKGGNFYGVPARLLAPSLGLPGVLHLAVNMRCHDLGYTSTDAVSPDFSRGLVPVGGGWWEDLDAGVVDIATAVEHARSSGCRQIFLVGHSSGGFYATRYAGEVGGLAGLVLLSPLTGNKTAFSVWFPDAADLAKALEHARELVASDRGHEIIPLCRWYYGISAASLLQRAAEPNGVWARNLEAAECPVLMVTGGAESRAALWAREMEVARHPASRTIEISGADHHYIGFEDDVRGAVAAFVAEHASPLEPATGGPS